MSEKLPLKTAEDCMQWFEKTINEVTQDPHSIALANTRNAGIKGMIGLQTLLLNYKRVVNNQGSTIFELQQFFASAPKRLEKK